MATVTIKANDTAIRFTSAITKSGVAVDLTGASVLMLLKRGATLYSLTAAIDGAATGGNVEYEPGTGFPTIAGTYQQEGEVTFSDATKLTFPSDAYNTVIITDDLN